MIFYDIKRKTGEIFFSEEPDWYWGLSRTSFFVIIIHYVSYKNFFIAHFHPYYPLPLFKYLRIPDPAFVQNWVEQFLPRDMPLSFLFLFLKTVVVISLFFCIMGLFQKFFTVLALISFFLFHGWFYGYIRTADDPYVYHSASIVCFILLVCLFSPFNRWTVLFWIKRILKKSGFGKTTVKEVGSSKYYPACPRLLIILTIAITFFSSFYCKFNTSGFQWINGYTLQAILLKRSVVHLLPNGYWLAQQNFYLLCFLIIGLYVFQSLALVWFLLRKTLLLYAIIGSIFHIFLLLFMGIWFVPFQYFYVVFIPEIVEFVQMRLKKFNKTKKLQTELV